MGTAIWAICSMIGASLFSAGGTFFLKRASSKMTLNFKKLITNWKLILGIFLYGISTIFALVAFKGGELSVLYPFVALQYIWANLLSRKYLGENICLRKWGGIALIFIGVSLIGFGA